MAVDRKQLLHIARLAQLSLDEAEVAQLEADLGSIVDYVAKLDELELAGIEPTTHMAQSRAPLRDDSLREGLSQEAALKEAPRTSNTSFAVPAFMDET